MTKREVINAMIKTMKEYDNKVIENQNMFKSALDIHNMHKDYMNKAINIAITNGYNSCKWQLWDSVCKERGKELNVGI